MAFVLVSLHTEQTQRQHCTPDPQTQKCINNKDINISHRSLAKKSLLEYARVRASDRLSTNTHTHKRTSALLYITHVCAVVLHGGDLFRRAVQ